MGVNGRRFLYGGSIGLYHRGPLSPRWKGITQKPDVAFVSSSLLPPPSFSISQPPSLWEQLFRSGWLNNLTAAISVTARKRSKNTGKEKGNWSLFVFVCSCLRKWHHSWSHLFIHPVISEERRRTYAFTMCNVKAVICRDELRYLFSYSQTCCHSALRLWSGPELSEAF